MKKSLFLFALTSIFLLSSCEKLYMLDGYKHGNKKKSFVAHLSGDQEVPSNESMAQGQATFKLSKDGMELSYKLMVSDIDSIMAAHIHLAPAGSNGGVVAWLYPSAPPGVLIPGTTNGVLAEGVITGASLVGALAGQPLSALTAKMMADSAYVNVHTTAFGGGEIRGQIK
jgi:hypothetical protein